MHMEKVHFRLLKLNGKCEILNFIEGLPSNDQKKVLATIKRIEVHGIRESAKMKWIKKLDGGICEIRSQLGSNIQRCLYFHKVDNVYVITHGFTKKTDKTPRKEIRHAIKLMKEFEESNNEK